MGGRHDALLAAAAARRISPGAGEADAGANAVTGAAAAIAARLADGVGLRVTGSGVCAFDAAHVSVEFLHPVIVGKRAVPALAVDPVDVADGTGAIVVGLLVDDDPEVQRALRVARGAGQLTVALHPGAVPSGAAVSVALDGADRLVVRESLVSAYHLLWETVHEHLDGVARPGDGDGADLAVIYPFLYGEGGDEGVVGDHVRRSTARKLVEVAELRARVLAEHRAGLLAAGDALRSASTVWTFGNGGSCTDAQAIAHLLGDRGLGGTPVRARALTDDVATVTALANDVGFDVVFARMLRTLGRPGDVAVAFSTSGSSSNVLAGLEAARSMGMATIGFAGYDGGDIAASDAVDHPFVVPSSSVHRIQEAQTTLAHVLVELARAPGG